MTQNLNFDPEKSENLVDVIFHITFINIKTLPIKMLRIYLLKFKNKKISNNIFNYYKW